MNERPERTEGGLGTQWDSVREARLPGRPKPQDFVAALVDDFIELHGDRLFGDDRAVIAGVGRFEGIPVTAIGTRKGHDFSENLRDNFGMPHPEGYRKALRLMRQAAKFRRPVLLFVDTPGAYAGIAAEERGVHQAISENLFEMSDLATPTLSVVTGEGGSGGALALAFCDRVLMLESAWYSVISPEGCASILLKDAALAPEAASRLKLDAAHALEFGLIDGVVPDGEILSAPQTVYDALRARIRAELAELRALPPEELVERRYAKYRAMGVVRRDPEQ